MIHCFRKSGCQKLLTIKNAAKAAELIANKGLTNAAVREVARTAGVSTGTVSYYYRNLKELLQAAYLTAFKSVSRRLIKTLNESNTFGAILHALFSTLPLEDKVLVEWKVRFAFWGANNWESRAIYGAKGQ